MAKIILFTCNDFSTTSGGTIRMYGILNALAENSNKVILISNTTDYSDFHPNIRHIFLNHPINSYSKRKFQLLLSILPISWLNYYYRKLFRKLEVILNPFQDENIIFFEYLDNSMGYWLKKNQIIKGYINDIHGIAPEEFKFQYAQSNSKREKFKLKIKVYFAKRLDKKVFDNAYRIIFPTQAMLEYWASIFPSVHNKDNIIIPNVLQNKAYYREPERDFIELKRKELDLNKSDRIILFAGGFKRSSGILDLIRAFSLIQERQKNTKLILLGDGPLMSSALALVKRLKINNIVYFTGFTDYKDLRSYQEIAHLLVCPDEENIFSHLIVHFKYLDALLANKVVINGNFRSVLEINQNEELSLGFSPSDVQDLARVMNLALDNYDHYRQKYSHTRDFILKYMTYQHQTKVLERVNHGQAH